MPSQKRSRYVRQQRRRLATEGHPTEQRNTALKAAAADRDKRLRELNLELDGKIAELQAKKEERRREIWKDYDERVALVQQALIIGAEA